MRNSLQNKLQASRYRRWLNLFCLACSLCISAIFVTACFEEEGGLNENEAHPGNQPTGNEIDTDVSLSEDGRYLVLRDTVIGGEDDLYSIDLTARRIFHMDASQEVERLLFGNGDRAYLLGTSYDYNVRCGGDEQQTFRIRYKTREEAQARIQSWPWDWDDDEEDDWCDEYEDSWVDEVSFIEEVSLQTGRLLGTYNLPFAVTLMTIDKYAHRLAAWNEEGEKLIWVDLVTDEVHTLNTPDPIVDVKWAPNSGDLMVVGEYSSTRTSLMFFNPCSGRKWTRKVPNCPSSLQISPSGRLAMMSPTHCNEDPVSVIDLGSREFLMNLPGFGPVAFAKDGRFALAFARRNDLYNLTGIQTSTEYSLLFIEAPNFNYEVVEFGDNLPIYSVTPNGELVLLYSETTYSYDYQNVVIFDTNTRSLREVQGPEIGLRNFVITPDSEEVYTIETDWDDFDWDSYDWDNYTTEDDFYDETGFEPTRLYRIDIDEAVSERVNLDCSRLQGALGRCMPDRINITPSGETLVLGYSSLGDFLLYDVATQSITDVIGLSASRDQIE